MSLVRCRSCERVWEASRVACCPGCLAERWLSTPNLVREKHDPGALGDRQREYRSVVTPRVIEDLRAVLEFAAAAGSWFHDTDYGMRVHLTPLPLGRSPGVGIPAGRRDPEHALDCLFIAEADSRESAHVFAVDGSRHAAQVRAGLFEPLGACDHRGCENLALPVVPSCAEHASGELDGWPGPSPASDGHERQRKPGVAGTRSAGDDEGRQGDRPNQSTPTRQ